MNNEMQIFNFEDNEIRILIDKKQEPWLVGKDVCSYFGDTNHKRSLSRIDDDEKTMVEVIDSLGRKQQATAINTSGLYSLLFAFEPEMARYDGVSPNAPLIIERIKKIKTFKRWITHDVLPSISRTGKYSINQSSSNPLVTQAEALVSSIRDYVGENETKYEQIEHRLNRIEAITSIGKIKAVESFDESGFFEFINRSVSLALPAQKSNYMTVTMYASVNNKEIDTAKAQILGRACASLSRKLGYKIEEVRNENNVKINAYHKDILGMVI